MDEPGSLPLQNLAGYYIGIVISFSLSFLFSGLEAGLLSLNRIWLSEKAGHGDRRAILLQKILRTPSRLISVMLTMEISANVVLAVLWTIIGYHYIEILSLPSWTLLVWQAALLILIVMFAEITPKALFAVNATRLTMALAPAANFLIKIVYPVAAVLEFLSRLLVWIFTKKWIQPAKSRITEEDLMNMISVGEDEGVIEEQEKEMIHSIFEFGDLVAREIMVPRIDMASLDIEDSVHDAINVIIETGHSRIPVYKESPDHIKGILYAKDLLRHIEKGDLDSLTLEQLLRPDVMFVPGTKNLTSLLEEMRAKKAHLAVVMDEYGGTAGLVTIEDILEEIVGDIQDEHDKPLERLIEKDAEGNWIVDGLLGLHDFEDEIEVTLPEPDGVETVGGLLYIVLGRVPEIGEVISVKPVKDQSNEDFETDEPDVSRVRFEVLEVQENRIGKIRIHLDLSGKHPGESNGGERK